MVLILISICLLLVVLSSTILTKRSIDSSSMTTSSSSVLASCLPPTSNINKREHEIYSLSYTVIWIAVFMVVIVTQMYEQFDAYTYLYLCVPLALPFLLQPILYPLPSERCLPLYLRYSFKANVWIAIFSFIGNYWYTHYFYSVLKARYTFPAHRLNDVPIALYFATHFYFMTYHTLSNMILRYIETRYLPDIPRTIFFWTAVVAFAYFTAFMETLTISSFPYYSFEDRYMAYTLGTIVVHASGSIYIMLRCTRLTISSIALQYYYSFFF